MELITSAEEIGFEQGIERSIKSLQRVIAHIVAFKLNELGKPLAERARGLNSLEALENLAEKLLDAESLTEVEKILKEIELAAKLN